MESPISRWIEGFLAAGIAHQIRALAAVDVPLPCAYLMGTAASIALSNLVASAWLIIPILAPIVDETTAGGS
jgi:hypothetical protein